MFLLGIWPWLMLFMFLLAIILPLICLIDIVRSQFSDSNNKLIWVLIVLFFPYLGSILYLLIGRGQKLAN